MPCSSASPGCLRPGSGSRCGCAPRGRPDAAPVKPTKRAVAGTAAAAAVTGAALLLAREWRKPGRRAGLRLRRGAAALSLAARGGARYASNAPRLFAAAGETRQQLRNDLALQTAEDVADTLGAMKGVLMKLGQMASYIDNG